MGEQVTSARHYTISGPISPKLYALVRFSQRYLKRGPQTMFIEVWLVCQGLRPFREREWHNLAWFPVAPERTTLFAWKQKRNETNNATSAIFTILPESQQAGSVVCEHRKLYSPMAHLAMVSYSERRGLVSPKTVGRPARCKTERTNDAPHCGEGSGLVSPVTQQSVYYNESTPVTP